MTNEKKHNKFKKCFYGLLNPSFELAVEDGIIRKNPVTGTLGDYGASAMSTIILKSHVENEMSKMNLPETVPAVV